MAIPKAPEGVTETREQTFARWLSDGSTFIAVFENHDLGHPDLGRRVALPYDEHMDDAMQLKAARLPDTTSIGVGWRYLLVAKCRSVESAVVQMTEGRDA